MRSLAALLLTGAVTLSGCAGGVSVSDGFFMRPGDIDKIDCKTVISRLDAARTRTAEAKRLLDKAALSTGGTAIGAVGYGPDYAKAQADVRSYEAAMASKQCQPTPLSGLR